MALPPYYPNTFTSVNDWSFQENSVSPVPIDPTYLVTAGDGAQVFRSKPNEGPGLVCINSFVPDVGRPYYLRVRVRKTVAQTNGIPSWLRPGFIAYPHAPTDYATDVVVIGPTFGEGLTAPYDFIDTSGWVIGEWYSIGCTWTPTAAYPEARPRIRVNRSGIPDGIPFSDAVYEFEKFEVLPQISMSDIRNEFLGPTPSKLSNYYRKTILSEITANVVDQQQEFDSMFNSEIGNHPSNFADDNRYITSDYGTLIPRGYTPSEISFPTVAPYGKVLQTSGQLWGGVIQPRSYGEIGYFALESGATYNLSMTRRIVTDPTTTHGFTPYQRLGVYLFDANRTILGGFEVIKTQITAADGWQTLSGSTTYAAIVGSFPTAVYARWYTLDNIYDFYEPNGSYNYYVGDGTIQTASIGLTKSGGGALPGSGISRIYDNRDKKVWDRTGNTWAISSTETFESLGAPRTCTNPYTHRIFSLGDFYVVDRPYTQRIPTSGQIKFSDFLGQKRAAGPIWHSNATIQDRNCLGPINLVANATSDDALPITYRGVDIPSYYTLNANTGVITGTVPYIDAAYGYQGFTITASDGFLLTNFSFTIRIVNQPPVWNTPAALSAPAGPFSLQFSATDPESHPVSYHFASGTFPPGTSFSLDGAGLLSGTVSAGTYVFEIAASDNFNSNFRTFTLTVT